MAVKTSLRITSIYNDDPKFFAVGGVPLKKDSEKVFSAKSLIFVRGSTELLEVPVRNGQHLTVTGEFAHEQAQINGACITKIVFEQPLSVQLMLPATGEAFIKFIAEEPDFKGIGNAKARELWRVFGSEIFRMLNNGTTDRLNEVLSEQSINALVEGYKKYENLRFARWFVERNIKHSVSRKVIKYHGKNTVEAIIDNPYELVNFGLSLTATDQLAQEEFKIKPDDARRLVAVVSSVIKQFTARHGHTLMYHVDVKKRALKIFNNDELLCKKALQVSHKSKIFVLNRHNGCYHHTPSLIMEKVVAKRLLRLKAGASLITSIEQTVTSKQINNNPFKLEEKQIEAVYSAIENHVSILTGGAGTGKTTTLKTILNVYHHLGYDIFPMALSGRAAMRLFEGTGYQSTTIARFLLSAPINDQSQAVIVIDEASMVDIATMYRLITHVHPSVRILLVGDHNQLPPVGSGLVLADMLKSAKIASVELTVPRRFHDETGICSYSNLIKNDEIPPNLNTGNIHFHETDEGDINAYCSQLLAADTEYSRIIAATNATVDNINDLAQSMVNPESEKMIVCQQQYAVPEKTNFRLNDKVIFTKNDQEAGVQNGTLGTLTSIEGWGTVMLEDESKEIVLDQKRFDTLRRAYCMTVHKTQGSQFRRVIIALTQSNLIDQSWLYTAVTRAEVTVELVGSSALFKRAIQRKSASYVRQTYLHQLLAEECESNKFCA